MPGTPPPVGLRQVFDVKTLELLVCPLTKTRLVVSPDGTELLCIAAHLAFPIVDGVPLLSLEEAREFDPDEFGPGLPDLSGNDGE